MSVLRQVLLIAGALLVLLTSGCDGKPLGDSATDADTDSPPDTSSVEDTESTPSGDDTGDTAVPVDADGDGFTAEEDCDDGDPDISPAAPEIPYDGVDQDCDGDDLRDVDGDGEDAEAVGGEDCDDEDPERFSGAYDVPDDGVDQDCDGVDAVRVPVHLDVVASSVHIEATREDEGRGPQEGVGSSVLLGGDYDGDGVGDIVIGDPYGYQGNIFLINGAPAETVKLPDDAHTVLFGERGDHWVGREVALAGDVDGDGYDDLWVGSSGGPYGFANYANRFYLLKGPIEEGTRDIYSASDAIVYGRDLSYSLGNDLSGGVDVNMDGVPDLLVTEDSGYVYLLTETSSLSGEEELADVISATLGVGERAEIVGDVNGDGFEDFLIALSVYGGFEGGKAVLFYGPVSGTYASEDADVIIEATEASGSVDRVSKAGDVDGDGYADIMLANLINSSDFPPGEVHLFSGDGLTDQTVTDSRTTFLAEEDEVYWLGYALESSDFDRDGRSDVVMTAPESNLGNDEIGEYVFLFYNPLEGQHVVTDADVVFTEDIDPVTRASFVGSEISAGDVDQDGLDDLLIGVPDCEVYSEALKGMIYPGCAYLFYGGTW